VKKAKAVSSSQSKSPQFIGPNVTSTEFKKALYEGKDLTITSLWFSGFVLKTG
jgi:hypothetical protein